MDSTAPAVRWHKARRDWVAVSRFRNTSPKPSAQTTRRSWCLHAAITPAACSGPTLRFRCSSRRAADLLPQPCMRKRPGCCRPPLDAGRALLRGLRVVLLAVDLLALLVLRVLDVAPLLRRHLAVRDGFVLHALHVRLPLLEPRRFFRSEGA